VASRVHKAQVSPRVGDVGIQTTLTGRAGAEAILPAGMGGARVNLQAGPEHGLKERRRHLSETSIDGRERLGNDSGIRVWLIPVRKGKRADLLVERECGARRNLLSIQSAGRDGHISEESR